MSFGQHLRGLRESAGLSRPELARRAGVPVSTLRNWEADRGFPGLAACLRLAEALGVPVERFAEGVEDPAGDEAGPADGKARRVRKGKAPPDWARVIRLHHTSGSTKLMSEGETGEAVLPNRAG